MKSINYIIIIQLCFSFHCCSQTSELEGKWVSYRDMTADGNVLNSFGQYYEARGDTLLIKNNKLLIFDGNITRAKFNKKGSIVTFGSVAYIFNKISENAFYIEDLDHIPASMRFRYYYTKIEHASDSIQKYSILRMNFQYDEQFWFGKWIRFQEGLSDGSITNLAKIDTLVFKSNNKVEIRDMFGIIKTKYNVETFLLKLGDEIFTFGIYDANSFYIQEFNAFEEKYQLVNRFYYKRLK